MTAQLTARAALDLFPRIKTWGEVMLSDWRLAVTAALFCTGVLVTCI